MNFPRGPLRLRFACSCLLASGLLACDSQAQAPPEPESLPVETLVSLWDGGIPFAEFLAGVEAREDLWAEGWDQGGISELNRAGITEVQQSWRLLVVAEDWCGDSAANIPDFMAVWLPLIFNGLRKPASSPANRAPGTVNSGNACRPPFMIARAP